VRLLNLQSQLDAPRRKATKRQTRACTSFKTACRQLDDARRAAQQANAESAKHADLSARLEALKALQEKCQDRWQAQALARKSTGWMGWPGLWSRIHVEPGWETALEAALRERMAALEVGRLDMVRAFASDAPPAKLSFYSAQRSAARIGRQRRCRAWPICCA
jgi:chromosome segregation protein